MKIRKKLNYLIEKKEKILKEKKTTREKNQKI